MSCLSSYFSEDPSLIIVGNAVELERIPYRQRLCVSVNLNRVLCPSAADFLGHKLRDWSLNFPMMLKDWFWFMSIQRSVPAAWIEQHRAKDGAPHSPSGAADWWRNEISDISNTSSYDSSLGTFVVLLVVYCTLQMASHKSGCVRCSNESGNINTSANPAKFWKFHEFGRTKRVVLNKMLSADKKNQLHVTFCILYFSSKVVKTGWQVVRPWTHYLPTGFDNLPAATAHTSTRL